MDCTASAAPEAVHHEPAIKQEFAPSFAPWNQFAPGQLEIDSSSDDDERQTDSIEDHRPQALASFAFSAMDSGPEANMSTLDTAPCEIGCAGQVEFKQEIEAFSKVVKSGLKLIRAPVMDQRDYSEGGVPNILDQLPCLDIHQASRIWNDPATPMLLPEVQYFIKYWRLTFLGVCAP